MSLEESKVSIYLGLEIQACILHQSRKNNACQQWHNSKETDKS
jgi:hypothetical protein